MKIKQVVVSSIVGYLPGFPENKKQTFTHLHACGISQPERGEYILRRIINRLATLSEGRSKGYPGHIRIKNVSNK